MDGLSPNALTTVATTFPRTISESTRGSGSAPESTQGARGNIHTSSGPTKNTPDATVAFWAPGRPGGPPPVGGLIVEYLSPRTQDM